jgi:FMN-dependent NADH-azoreductase
MKQCQIAIFPASPLWLTMFPPILIPETRMTRILRIDASSRPEGAHSRELANMFISEWLAREPDAEIMQRDLADVTVPHIANETIQGYYTPAEQMTPALKEATALSDLLITEVIDADVLLIATPMYNFSVPSALKAWIDQIVRIGRTFSYDGKSFTGLLPGRRAFIMVAYGAGGYLDGGPFAAADFLQPYLRFLLGFLGISDVTFVAIEQTTADAATVAAGRARAAKLIDSTVATALSRQNAA